MATFSLIHGAGDVGWYWHLDCVALSRPKELASLVARCRRVGPPVAIDARSLPAVGCS
jgi:hypothetical protein